ncbi:antibiotic ABC transporter ATP-binding protein [Fulvitalea axinellae]|uniref:Antibiotic ABC transporter ATP-binding protein n=1 Tax=Fulvitalea axinellae TaxID=1182444 RepID=A0AAU9CE06_9BACT|nr:antibiotic ABC transporter ATP-binding protein [Fulvitalea axinellae]
MNTYLRVLGFAKPLGTRVPQYLFFSILYSVFSLGRLALLMPVLKLLFTPDKVSADIVTEPTFDINSPGQYFSDLFNYYFTPYIKQGPLEALEFVCVILFASAMLSSLFRYLSDLILAKISASTHYNLQNATFGKINALELGFFTNERKGDIMSRMTNDMVQVNSTIVSSMTVIFREPILIISYFGALIAISPKLTILALLVLPLSGGLIASIAKRLKKKAKKSQESAGKVTVILEEALSGMRVIKAFNATSFILEKFARETRRFKRLTISIARRRELASPLSEFLGIVIIIGIVLYGGKIILTEQEVGLSGDSFITFIAIFSQILTPAKNISKSMTNIQRGIAAAERIFEVVDSDPKVKDKEGAIKLEAFNNSVEFDNISFAYTDDLVLRNINLKVGKGQTLALVGPSGGGKSTLADLVPRFYDPVDGSVKIDGLPLTAYETDSLRNHMGIVTQESILFNDTVYNNISFGIQNTTQEEVEKAAKIANAHEFIEGLEDGYRTMIGERGSKLSGGQRQRLSIARAVLKNPDILILDEATSALDSESEKLVQNALNNLMKNRTAIVIAHRLSTVQHADKIAVVQNGQIAEEGTHDELMAKNGVYSKLIAMQSL